MSSMTCVHSIAAFRAAMMLDIRDSDEHELPVAGIQAGDTVGGDGATRYWTTGRKK
jgi:hypothetical protein